MKILKDPGFQFTCFLSIFFVINILQSNFTYLFEDEAYYYVWSKHLAFGYFDHPPMVALWAAIGQTFADGELGIRLLSAVSFSLLIYVIWSMIEHHDKWKHVILFCTVIVSLAFWQVFGFIMTPDTPLLLFTALFLWAYKRFLKEESIVNVLLLGFGMSAMLYSKYHGLLVIVFVLLSNLKLMKNPRFWLAAGFGLLLFLPHLNWQYQNGFPSFVYHLKERGKKPYSILNNLTHLVNMIAVVGLTFPVIYSAFYKYKTTSLFERSLKFIVYGFFVFFFIVSFLSEPQAQWVIVILIPLALLVFPYFVNHPGSRRWLYMLTGIQLGILMVFRLFLSVPEISPVPLEPHVSQQWIPDLEKNTHGRPVVFVNSYRNASLYNFYTGIKTHSYSILKGRKSQYNLLDFEDQMQGENVFSASLYNEDQPKLAKKGNRFFHGRLIENYNTFEKAKCIINSEKFIVKEGINDFEFTFVNSYRKNITFDQVRFTGVFQGYKNKIIAKVPLEIVDLEEMGPGEEKILKARFNSIQLPKNESLTFRVALDFYDLQEGYQGNKVTVVNTNQ